MTPRPPPARSRRTILELPSSSSDHQIVRNRKIPGTPLHACLQGSYRLRYPRRLPAYMPFFTMMRIGITGMAYL
jgi:hypothetical protein